MRYLLNTTKVYKKNFKYLIELIITLPYKEVFRENLIFYGLLEVLIEL